MNSENCKTSEPHRVRPDLIDKLNLDLQKHGFSQCDTWKTMILLEFLMVLTPLETSKTTCNLSSKKHETLTKNPPVQIYVK